jgi:hypothetical protein
MAFVDTSSIHARLDTIKQSAAPRVELCRYVNGLQRADMVFFLRYIAGWPMAEYYGNRGFRSTGDTLFDELCSDVGIE